MYQTSCRYFSGYKPCSKSQSCDEACAHRDIVQTRVLLVHLGALGAVVRSTALLKSIKRKYHASHITWITDAPAHHLLKNNSLIDRVLTTSTEDLLSLQALHFDVALVIDKSLKASGVVKSTMADQIFGFCADERTGAILPVTESARELWEIGLNNQKKFFENKKTEIQLMSEALELSSWNRDEYFVPLSSEEKALSIERRGRWQMAAAQPVIGLNTGCSSVIPYKKWTVDYHRQVIAQLSVWGFKNIVLLGGPEDQERNKQIAQGLPVIFSPTNLGLRDGLVSVDACDVVISGDSLGMHMAIARKKYVIAWFGPTCAHEIELYDRGEALVVDMECSPCWKRDCQKQSMCYDQISLQKIELALQRGVQYWIKNHPSSSIKPPFLETSY